MYFIQQPSRKSAPESETLFRGLARSTVRVYTPPVNAGKLIQSFLIAALCYGQLVTSVHFVGHFDDHNHSSEYASAVAPFGVVLHEHHENEHSDLTLSEHHRESAAPGQNSDHTDFTCAIYHAFLNLSGILYTASIEFSFPPRQSVSAGYSQTPVTNTATYDQPIRAPPTFS
ncbi:hypothetical protein AB833_09805 [Chromatiales bacterium (ex Bugula neritina AB1)]|nr:hypothetical protein AB833_09805 [Chromatiales bacterium (ex Bugula neritina AB1)]